MKIYGEKHEVLESTQKTLKERLKQNQELRHGYFVSAEVQTSGRGRSDHVWISVAGNFHVSILLKTVPFPQVSWVPLWVAVCLHETLMKTGSLSETPQLKWPNDLWVGQSKKIAGILCEKIGNDILLGVGVNLLHAPHECASVVPIAPGLLLSDQLLENFMSQLTKDTSLDNVKEYYLRHSLFKHGDEISWFEEKSARKQTGVVQGLGEHGELLVQQSNQIVSLYSEEVHLARVESVSPK